MKVSVIGLGYIGLPTAALLASRKIEVIGVDVNQKAVDTINQGGTHFLESELDMLVKEAVKSNYLRATKQPEKADVFILALPTPLKGNNEPDISYIESVAKAIATLLEKGNLVILESTSPVGTTEKMVNWFRDIRPDLVFPKYSGDGSEVDISIAHCPERVLPGNIVKELIENDRIIGGVTTNCAELASDFYKIFVQAECLITDCRTAELSKLIENSYRDVNIAFANELSLICDKFDINVWNLIKLTNRHPRVNILQPGPGVGGHCIAVDPWFVVNAVPDESQLIYTARRVNDSKPNFVLKKIHEAVTAIGKDKSELSIACLGLAFKPDIDDLRESPAMKIAKQVRLMGFYKQYIVEPNISHLPEDFDRNITELVELKVAVEFSDVVVLLVDHSQFQEIDHVLLKQKQLVDTRGVWSSL